MYDEPITATHEVLSEAYRLLPNGEGFFYKEWMSETFLKVLKIYECDLVELSKDLNWFNVVVLVQRDIGSAFSEYLENNFFAPTTERNDKFHYRLFKWEDMDWAIFSVPVQDANCAYVSASATNCRLADGVPHLIGMAEGGRGVANARHPCSEAMFGANRNLTELIFPLNNNQTFTLEPDHGRRGPVIGAVGLVDPAPVRKPREPDLLDLIRARRKKKR